MRRLLVLIRALPPEASLWPELEAAEKAAQKPTAELIRERQAHYDAMREKG